MSGQKVEGQCPITGTKSTSDVTPPIVSNQPVEVQSPVTMEKLDLSTTEQETQSDIKQCPFMSGEKVTGQCPITGVSH
ncbi:hypothetical protein K7432_016918 [Basidiobolus ranarum]|uniref:Uncharacterized protein n=1 Tax=Basidiobolus ranarum TaxID=34480 RepID=A0ABR2WE28_9FUNG